LFCHCFVIVLSLFCHCFVIVLLFFMRIVEMSEFRIFGYFLTSLRKSESYFNDKTQS